MSNIVSITHPDYNACYDKWYKYRYVLESGRTFVEEYLRKFSTRETSEEFTMRRGMAYCPSFAKAALIDIRNAIYQRTSDIRRIGGSSSYQLAASGEQGGVDLRGNSMDGFIGRTVLTELLAMSKVAVFVDKQPATRGMTLAETNKLRPYLYVYKAEDIRSWSVDSNNQLTHILLRNYGETTDPDTGLTIGISERYRHIYKNGPGVIVDDYDANGKQTNQYILDISVIPVAIFSLTNSVLEDAADYQIALLNMESSDTNYILKSNFPFYTEQYNPHTDATHIKGSDKEVEVGVTKGRRYPQGMERPGFIAPPSEPLKVSMEKEEAIKADIRRVVNLNVTSITPTRASAESKATDMQGLEAGLAYIGTELQFGENQIANIWAEYEGSRSAVVKYPTRYTLTSIDERLDTAKKVREEMPMVPSKTYQKEMAKEVVTQIIGAKASSETLDRIHSEIDSSDIIVTDPDILKQDHEAGFVSTKTASEARGYADDEWIQAGKDHAERAARIVMAQTSAKDMSTSQDRVEEKTNSQTPDVAVNAEKGVRS